jgi:hypothetical protein
MHSTIRRWGASGHIRPSGGGVNARYSTLRRWVPQFIASIRPLDGGVRALIRPSDGGVSRWFDCSISGLPAPRAAFMEHDPSATP